MMGGALPFELFPGHQAPSCSDNEALSAMVPSERPAREKFLNFVGDSSSSASHPGGCGCRRGTPLARMRAGRAPLDPTNVHVGSSEPSEATPARPRHSMLPRIDKKRDDRLFAKRLGGLQPVETLN
jgi:hypothetical protein